MRKCTVCGKYAEEGVFPKNKYSSDGLKSICKECINTRNREKYVSKRKPKQSEEDRLAKRRHWYSNNKDKIKASRLKSHYSLTLDEYYNQSKLQNNLCACCGVYTEILYVDHDHFTREIRGLICQKCNTGIGMLGDSIEGIKKALNYLEKK